MLPTGTQQAKPQASTNHTRYRKVSDALLTRLFCTHIPQQDSKCATCGLYIFCRGSLAKTRPREATTEIAAMRDMGPNPIYPIGSMCSGQGAPC